MQIPFIFIYLPAILSLMPFPLIVPPLEPKSSSAGTEKFLRWNRKVPRGELFLELVCTTQPARYKEIPNPPHSFRQRGQYELPLSCLRLALYSLQVTSSAVVARHVVQFVRRARGSDRAPREYFDAVRIAYRAHTVGND